MPSGDRFLDTSNALYNPYAGYDASTNLDAVLLTMSWQGLLEF